MASPAVANALDSVAAIQGITTSYVNFTTKLVSDVMNALVSSSISQMRAYSDLVSSLERGLAAFKAQVSTPQAMIKWLQNRIPETGSDPTTLKIPTDSLSQASADIIRDLYGTKLVSILGTASDGPYVLPGFGAMGMSSLPNTPANKIKLVNFALTDKQILKSDGTGAKELISSTKLTSTADPEEAAKKVVEIDLLNAVLTVLAYDAAISYQMLDKLVQMGMSRIVITDGHILTKMTFNMETSDSSQRNSQDIYGSSFAVSGSAGASWGWGSASIKASYNSFNVHLANEHAQTSTDIQVAMMGEVLCNYKSDYFPALPSQAKQ